MPDGIGKKSFNAEALVAQSKELIEDNRIHRDNINLFLVSNRIKSN